MTGPKTNEGATKVGERTGTRAVVRYVRVSASKAREVLDLIRGLDAKDADDVLRFAERDVGHRDPQVPRFGRGQRPEQRRPGPRRAVRRRRASPTRARR